MILSAWLTRAPGKSSHPSSSSSPLVASSPRTQILRGVGLAVWRDLAGRGRSSPTWPALPDGASSIRVFRTPGGGSLHHFCARILFCPVRAVLRVAPEQAAVSCPR